MSQPGERFPLEQKRIVYFLDAHGTCVVFLIHYFLQLNTLSFPESHSFQTFLCWEFELLRPLIILLIFYCFVLFCFLFFLFSMNQQSQLILISIPLLIDWNPVKSVQMHVNIVLSCLLVFTPRQYWMLCHELSSHVINATAHLVTLP